MPRSHHVLILPISTFRASAALPHAGIMLRGCELLTILDPIHAMSANASRSTALHPHADPHPADRRRQAPISGIEKSAKCSYYELKV